MALPTSVLCCLSDAVAALTVTVGWRMQACHVPLVRSTGSSGNRNSQVWCDLTKTQRGATRHNKNRTVDAVMAMLLTLIGNCDMDSMLLKAVRCALRHVSHLTTYLVAHSRALHQRIVACKWIAQSLEALVSAQIKATRCT